jgi:hypothetical protein
VCSPLLSTVFFVLLNFFEKAVLIGINYVGQQGELSGCEYKYKQFPEEYLVFKLLLIIVIITTTIMSSSLVI